MRDEAALQAVCQAIEALRDAAANRSDSRRSPRTSLSAAPPKPGWAAMAWAITAIVLVLSFVGILNTMLMSVIERTQELGILRAVGWRRSRVLRMILGESFVISLAGAIVGLVGLLAACCTCFRNWPGPLCWCRTAISSAALAIGFAVAIVAGVAGSLYPAFAPPAFPRLNRCVMSSGLVQNSQTESAEPRSMPLLSVVNVSRGYDDGAVQALTNVSLDDSGAASIWRSWAPAAAASRRC